MTCKDGVWIGVPTTNCTSRELYFRYVDVFNRDRSERLASRNKSARKQSKRFFVVKFKTLDRCSITG